uniref:Uncharacterized protein MANES_10G118700 n=1 Tax=Rhizophora mucronata TaxID=61149 RepID=A0A2P2K5U4_RHIMU
MKRKRGNKRGKKKGSQEQTANEPAPIVVTLDREDNSGIDGSDSNYNNNNDDGKDEYASRMEVDTPSSTGTDQPLNVASINPDGSIDKTTGKSVGRVKVKLKTSKTLESHSDTDKSSLQLGLDKHGVVSDKMEDSGSSLPEVKMGVPGNISKKPGSIKITSFKGHSSLNVEKSSNAVAAGNDSVQQKEVKTTDQGLRYNKEELDSALLVIKKVMKMEAAEPFNVPVNPEALGIPVSMNHY